MSETKRITVLVKIRRQDAEGVWHTIEIARDIARIPPGYIPEGYTEQFPALEAAADEIEAEARGFNRLVVKVTQKVESIVTLKQNPKGESANLPGFMISSTVVSGTPEAPTRQFEAVPDEPISLASGEAGPDD